MDSWALFSVSSHFFHSSHLQGAGGYEMTGACFTWPHSVSSLCFSCKFWQEFLWLFLKEVLEDPVGKQPLADVGCVSTKAIKSTTWKVAVVFLPLQGPNPGMTSETLTSTILVGWAVAWNCFAFTSCFLTLLGQSTALVESIYHVICLGTFTPALILLGSFLTESYFIFLVQLEFYTPRKSEVSKVLLFIHIAASTISLRSIGQFRIFLDMWLIECM